jgi:hypothetical protein
MHARWTLAGRFGPKIPVTYITVHVQAARAIKIIMALSCGFAHVIRQFANHSQIT